MAVYRYWRLKITGTFSGYIHGGDEAGRVAEFELMARMWAAGILNGGTASASSGNATASSAFDKDHNTAWYSDVSAALPLYLNYDLGLGNESDAAQAYVEPKISIGAFTIQCSTDNVTWVDRASRSADTTSGTYITLSTAPNTAPVITSNGGGATASIDITENSSTYVTTVTATDADLDTLSYSLTGIDSAEFTLNPTTHEIHFNSMPDYENPTDSGLTNTYHITVTVDDSSAQDSQDLTINVLDIALPFTNNGGGTSVSIDVSENSTAVTTVQATGATSYAITGGTDAALFEINSGTGDLSFITAPDYEAPADIDGNNLYQVIVTASDGTDSDTQTLNVFVTDASPIFTNNGGGTSIALSVDENTTTVTTVVAAGSTYAITGGDDAALFQIDSATGDLSFIAAPDFELPSDANADNDYSIIVSATAGSETAYQSITISVADVLPGVGAEPVAGLNWSRVITIGGVDVSAQITGVCVVEAEESTSRIASFSLRPEAGTISAGDWLGVSVTINYKTVSSSGVEISNNRLFTGIVDQAIYDPNTRLTSFDCTDDMQGRFEAMTQTEINDLIVDSRWSDAVFGDYTDGWRYLEDILSTHPQSYDYNADGVTGTLVDWAAKVTPDFSYDSSGIIDGSISYSITPKRELFNSYTINYSYRFGRLIHRDHNFSWSLNFCPYFAQSHELPTREMITVAATSAGWNLTSAITFKALPDSNVDPCNTGVAWTISDENQELLALGASWKASKRWTQTATENYTITVNAPQSVSWLGEVAFKESASNSTELDADGWADGVETPTGRTNSQGDIVQDKYDRSISNNDLETLIARARTEILSSHRTNFVSADILLNPLLERFHTVRLDDNGIVGQGKVSSFVHRTDSDTGEAITSVRIAVSLNGGAAASGDDAITAPSAPTTDPATTAPSNTTVLSTNIGGDDSAPAFDESWDGFSGNYSIPVGVPAENQYYARRFKVVTPDINQDAVDAIEAEAAASYSFDIPDETLTITVA